MKIELTVVGVPIGKMRPRFSIIAGHPHVRTAAKTVKYENLIRLAYEDRYGIGYQFPPETPLEATIMIFKAIPLSLSKTKHTQAENGQIKPITKPDIDNIAKSVLDALNKVAFDDDSRVVRLVVEKHFAPQDYIHIVITDFNVNTNVL